MGVLSDDELAAARADFEALLTQRCDIQSKGAPARTASGGRAGAWGTAQAAVPCSVAPSGRLPVEVTLMERYSADTLWRVLVPAGTVIKPEWRIIAYEVDAAGVKVDGTERTLDVISAVYHTPEITRMVLAREVT